MIRCIPSDQWLLSFFWKADVEFLNGRVDKASGLRDIVLLKWILFSLYAGFSKECV